MRILPPRHLSSWRARHCWRAILVSVAGMAISASTARAELVFFASGQALSVKGHRIDGDSLVLMLRGGGELACSPSLAVRFAPDEVPYPEDAPLPAVRSEPDPTSLPYGELIDKLSKAQGIPSKLVRAVSQVESAYQQGARSRKGAMGLMQLMPETARRYALADPYDPESNIEAGIKHLKSLMQRFPLALALAAYNAGEVAVQRFRGVPPYPETRQYVYSVLELFNR